MIKLNQLSQNLSSCCEIDAFSNTLCTQEEKELLNSFLPDFKSVIVIAHHIKSSVEWMWYPLESERNKVTCPADLHIQLECNKIASVLEENNYKYTSIPYPGRCGIRFKNIADKTGLGKIGDNFLFIHRNWGAWAHLRVILTDAEITDTLPPCNEVCLHCYACKAACPAQVIKDDDFIGVDCGKYQGAQDRLLDMKGNYIFKCEECLRSCPIGEAPQKILVSKA